LQKAFDSAERSFVLSETLYREGEISFLDVLDAQRTVNEADSALVSAEAAQAESLVRLYKSLGVY
jgi:multidrug efflux system outer membrane protein